MIDIAENPQVSDSLDDRMKILTQELELAIRWQQPSVILVAYGSIYVRDDSISVLENYLMDMDKKIVKISASDSAVNSLEFWHRILEDTENVVFFLEDFSNIKTQKGFINILNHHKYLFTENNTCVICWLTNKETSTLAYQAPFFWTGRQCLVELADSPKPEQILQSALESAWQGIGEYSDQFQDTEAKITLQESFLTELPHNRETTSIRANLLLTLGVLHWRKGDYEKADEMLQQALLIVSKMQDNWFEARCFNAVALVYTSLGKNEDAIDAYKQAIELAPDQIFAWNNLGNLCLQIGRNDEALIAFQKAIEQNSSDPMAWNGMGNVYARSEYIDDAIAAYRKSIELAPLLSHPWNGLGTVYAHSGRTKEAVVAYRKAIELNDHLTMPWLGLAKLYADQERYREASKAYQQALMIDPLNKAFWNELGCLYLEAGQFEDSVEALLKAIELDRSFGWAYSNLGLAYAGNEMIEESIPIYLKSLDLLKDQVQRSKTWNRLADAYRMMDKYEDAIKAYQMADSLNSNNSLPKSSVSDDPQLDPVSEEDTHPEVEAVQGDERSEEDLIDDIKNPPEINSDEEETPCWIFQSEDQDEDVIHTPFETSSNLFNSTTQTETTTQKIGGLSMQMTLPSTLKKIMPETKVAPVAKKTEINDAHMWNEKGNYLLQAGAYEDAINAYNKAIAADRSFGWAYTNLGIAYLQLGKYAEAALLLQKSLEFLNTDEERAVAWNELGNLYRCLNDYHNAVVSYQKADELDPTHDGARDTVEYLHSEPTAGNEQVWNELGDSFSKAGSYEQASNCYRKVTEIAPNDGWSFYKLASSLAHQTKFDEAVPLYKKSIELFADDKDKADIWNRLGNVYRRLNDYGRAVDAYQNAVKLNNESKSLLMRTRFSLLGNCGVD
ncbi:MAG TPA: tetratricopeptide repeat protein [Anaerolineales bacterium]|nr:tetratricopeptide repeat protein [Anaerolineales bacterium]